MTSEADSANMVQGAVLFSMIAIGGYLMGTPASKGWGAISFGALILLGFKWLAS